MIGCMLYTGSNEKTCNHTHFNKRLIQYACCWINQAFPPCTTQSQLIFSSTQKASSRPSVHSVPINTSKPATSSTSTSASKACKSSTVNINHCPSAEQETGPSRETIGLNEECTNTLEQNCSKAQLSLTK